MTSLNSALSLQTSELENATTRIGELKDSLAAANEELQASRNETNDLRVRLAGDLEAVNRSISNLEDQISDLTSKSSTLENTVTEVEKRNAELQTTVGTFTILTCVAIIVAVIAVALATAVTLRRSNIRQAEPSH